MNLTLTHLIRKHYGLQVLSVKTLKNRFGKHILLLSTDQGTYILKGQSDQANRLIFSHEAQEFLHKTGVAIPLEHRTLKDKPFITYKKKRYVLQEYITGSSPSPLSTRSIKKIAETIGRFHHLSVGFQHEEAKEYAESKNWKREYKLDIRALQNWNSHHLHSTSKKMKIITKYLPRFINTGKFLQQQLLQDAYYLKWKTLPIDKKPLCHGDYHPLNVINSKKKYYLIDWEDVRHDYVSKDIGRMFFRIMESQKSFSKDIFESYLHAYQKENPLSSSQLKLLYLDLAFPHMVERFLRKKLYRRLTTSQLEKFFQREWKKTDYMKKMWNQQ
ncbi:phosphotransferase [Brevibacillus daliensis]|uniref:phosphotransferase n=1 Tax=Brevibacillus daliensis TaxID=2892995 RepID=UPI001E60E203|nr:phosphotransferase [Brevibacillus daliensis]